MRDALATLQSDQDAIIRAGSRGTLVVDGGPGTGKTVVALHRAAYLLYADPRLREGRGGVLFVGPSRPYLSYVADVLPSLGEEGVQTCTLRDLVPEVAGLGEEPDPAVARLKSTAEMVTAIEPAVALYEEPPADGLEVSTPYGDVWAGPDDWAEAFGSLDPGTPHNDGRDQVWEELLTVLADKMGLDDSEVSEREVRAALALLQKTLPDMAGRKFDAVISAVPMLSFPVPRRVAYVEALLNRLPAGRPVVQITYGARSPIPSGLGNYQVEHMDFVLRNFPPAQLWLYRRPWGH